MIKTCDKCGGLYATRHLEMFAGTPCSCPWRMELEGTAPPEISLRSRGTSCSTAATNNLMNPKNLRQATRELNRWLRESEHMLEEPNPVTANETLLYRIVIDRKNRTVRREPIGPNVVFSDSPEAARSQGEKGNESR